VARSFNGTSAYISVPNSTVLNFNASQSQTVACWIKYSSSQSSYTGLVCKGQLASLPTGATGQYQILLYGDKLGCEIDYIGSGGAYGPPQGLVGTTVLDNNVWHHCCVTIAKPAGTCIIYVAGSQESTTTASQIANDYTDTYPVLIGVERTETLFFGGSMAEVGIWNVVLTAGEILALAKGCRTASVRPASLVGYWPIWGLASPEPDMSGNANNGTLTGTAKANGPPIDRFTWTNPNFYQAASSPPTSPLFLPSPMTGLGAGGPFYTNPIG